MKFHYKASAGGASKKGDIVGEWVCVRNTLSQPGPDNADWAPVAVSDPVWDSLDGDKGERGERGERGPASTVPGPAGADGEAFNPRGEWKRKTDYRRLDVVYVPGEGAFVATIDNPTKSPTSSKSGWMQITADGADGKDGEAVVYAQRGRPGRDGRDAVADTPAIADSPMQVGDVIYASGAGRVELALASPAVDDSDGKAFAIGVVTTVNGSAIAYRTSGVVTNPAWNLTPRTVYYLSPATAGGLTSEYTEQSGEFVVIVGTAVSPTQLALNIHWMLENE